MLPEQPSPGIVPLPRRPRSENGLAGIVGGALLGWLFTENPVGAIAGGAVGNVLTTQPLSLDAAIRAHFATLGLAVIGFYRLGPRAAMVLFRHHDKFWTVGSSAPDDSNWMSDDLDDWLYGDIVANQLPRKLAEIDALLTR